MSQFKLPELGEGLSEGEIVAWKVKEGDTIRADSPVVEVMTDKATVEVPSPKSGVIKKLYYKVGEMAKVGAPLIDIEEAGSVAAEKPAPNQASEKKSEPVAAAPKQSSVAAVSPNEKPQASAERVLASPAVRRMARELSLDLSRVRGSGERGRVLRNDLATTTPQTIPLKT